MSLERRSDGPVLGGDILRDGSRVLGFAFADGELPDETNDHLLLEGDERSAKPPRRPVPRTAQDVHKLAPLPPYRLTEPARVHEAQEISADLPDAMSRLLRRPGAAWATVADPLLRELREAGHQVWVAGGAARDVLRGDEVEGVADIDLAGTAPPGRFTAVARKVLTRLGLEHREKVSASRLICSARPVSGDQHLYEYRALALTGFPYPASGSDMAVDASTRDLTINSLYYDPDTTEVVDPTGRGLKDLRSWTLQSANRTTDPAVQAAIVLRAVKFVARWSSRSLNLDDLRRWIPDDLTAGLDESSWDALALARAETLKEVPLAQQSAAAEKLGPVAMALLAELVRRQS